MSFIKCEDLQEVVGLHSLAVIKVFSCKHTCWGLVETSSIWKTENSSEPAVGSRNIHTSPTVVWKSWFLSSHQYIYLKKYTLSEAHIFKYTQINLFGVSFWLWVTVSVLRGVYKKKLKEKVLPNKGLKVVLVCPWETSWSVT